MSDSATNKSFISKLKKPILFLFGIFLLFLAFKEVEFQAILDELKTCNWWWIILAKVFGIFTFYIRAIRWNMLIQTLGYNPSTKNTFVAIVSSLFVNMVVPRFGEIFRCWAVGKTEKAPVNSLIGTVIIERLIDVVMFLFFTVIVLVVHFGTISNIFINEVLAPIGGKFSNLFGNWKILSLLLVVVLFSFIGLFLMRKKRGKFYRKIKRTILQFLVGIRSIRKLQNPVLFIVYSFLTFIIGTFSLYISAFAFSSLNGFSVKDSLLTFTMSGYGMAAPVQAGLGAYEVMVRLACEMLGYTKEAGLAFATAMHGSSILWQFVFGLSFFLVLYFKFGSIDMGKIRTSFQKRKKK